MDLCLKLLLRMGRDIVIRGYARWNMGLTSDYSETEFGFSPDDPFACFECADFIQRNLVVL